ncbi:MAG TPA: hypothetical protein DCS91_01675 [Microcoleaceae bacterium UBA11344]|jgi:hypothetical protein|nr:hypothetical protein [Microcoleaceae cyanobacterium UBA11344]
MPYSDFSLEKVKRTFELTTSETVDLFGDIPELECSALLTEILRYNVPLAVASNSEKARSEMIISPILIDLRRQLRERINLFSGIEFDVDSERGLNGICDFIISNSPEILFVSAPVITLVEAKKENITAGLGQCVAEMLAARIFNERAGNEIFTIYGAVTTGSIWKFMKLEGSVIRIDLTEYYLKDVNKILGILAMGAVSQPIDV